MQNYNPEAVEAARKYALNDKHLSRNDCALLHDLRLNNKEQIEEAAARILAAEVERLREQNKRHGIDLCAYVAEVAELRGKADAVCEWRIIESGENAGLVDTQCGWRCGQTADYCPGCGRKVKIQPQTDDNEQ